MNQARRRWLTAHSVLLASTWLGGCASPLRVASSISAIVDGGCTAGSCTQEGVAVFPSIASAIAAAPQRTTDAWRILVRPGNYVERLVIDRAGVHLIGAGAESTRITSSVYAGQTRPEGGVWGTAGSATVTVRAPGFVAENLTFENGFDYLTNDARAVSDPARTNQPQAVALMLDRGSDRAHFRNVALRGFQDTLFANTGRVLFRDCTITGNVDFIFGAGQAWFERCDIVTRQRAQPDLRPQGFITAPSTSAANAHGFVFMQCRLTKESAAVPAASVALGRPWRPTVTRPDGRYGDPDAVGHAVFAQCWMDDHILPEGWVAMAMQSKGGGERVMLEPDAARFFEFDSRGPGAQVSARRRQLNPGEASALTMAAVLGDWIPILD